MPAAAVGIGHHARLDGFKGIIAVLVGAATGKAAEARIRQRALVLRIREAPLRVGLPDLQHGIGHNDSVAVEHAALDPDAIAGDVGRQRRVGERIIPCILAGRRQAVFEERADGLRRRDPIVLHLMVLHRGGVLAAQHDVKAVTQRPFGLGVLEIK